MKRPYIERPLCRVFYSPDQTKPRTDLSSAAARRSHLPGKFLKTGRLPPRRAAAAPGPPERLGARGVATGDRACVRGGSRGHGGRRRPRLACGMGLGARDKRAHAAVHVARQRRRPRAAFLAAAIRARERLEKSPR